jgi:diaminopimelate epimerase
MHGLGNDILILDCIEYQPKLNAVTIQQLSDRHASIGFDQLITIERCHDTEADFSCQIYNADGSMAEQCGNGMRCVARYLHEYKRYVQNTLYIKTIAGIVSIVVPDYDHIAVNMSTPQIQQDNLPLTLSSGKTVTVTSLSLGNPHIVLPVDHLADIDVAMIGKELSTHAHFANGTNVGFMQINNPHDILLRTYERGAGLTLACGSNSCAAAVAGIHHGWLQSPVTVNLARGQLTIQWNKAETLIMQGPAAVAFDGAVSL